MRDVIAPEGPVMQFFARIFDMVVVSIVFTVTCIPLITAGCSLTALYYAVVKAVYQGEGHVVKAYFHCFRINGKQGLGLGIGSVILSAVLLGNLYLVFTMDLGMIGMIFGILFLAMIFVMLVLVSYGFPVLSRFEVQCAGLLQSVIQISVTHLSATFQLFVMEIMLFVGMAAAFVLFPPIIIIWPGLLAYAKAKVLEPILQEYISRSEI